MTVNWFMVLIAVLYLGASGWEFRTGSRFLGVVYLSWFVSNMMMAIGSGNFKG